MIRASCRSSMARDSRSSLMSRPKETIPTCQETRLVKAAKQSPANQLPADGPPALGTHISKLDSSLHKSAYPLSRFIVVLLSWRLLLKNKHQVREEQEQVDRAQQDVGLGACKRQHAQRQRPQQKGHVNRIQSQNDSLTS